MFEISEAEKHDRQSGTFHQHLCFCISGESQVHMHFTESNEKSSKREIANDSKSDIKVNIIFMQQSDRVKSYKNQPPLFCV